ncbi:hypothetical protein AB4Z48_26535 [Cupriavidus sp. 2TAF22]|uniref:hypothetical protein n=1 Tax=unclassified Cupriavidus TaxID=2640874 RepID=UPI003F8FBD6C
MTLYEQVALEKIARIPRWDIEIHVDAAQRVRRAVITAWSRSRRAGFDDGEFHELMWVDPDSDPNAFEWQWAWPLRPARALSAQTPLVSLAFARRALSHVESRADSNRSDRYAQAIAHLATRWGSPLRSVKPVAPTQQTPFANTTERQKCNAQ